MSKVFSEQILADKLAKVNSTQQCIETLSHWCIFHRSKAEVVVATWEKIFHSSEMAQKIPLLYLANDILQNSKKNGNEFVSVFWKVLPTALKDVIQKGDDRGKTTVSRLIRIWEERRVFGSRAQNLEKVMLGEEVPPPLEFGSKKRARSTSIKIVKKDSRSIRMKLSVGGAAEKIVSAFHSVLNEQPNEDAEMDKCKSVINRVRKLEKDVNITCSTAKDPKRKYFAKELVEEEDLLKQCIEKLKLVETNRATLVTQLKEALHEQESELEIVRTQMQLAHALSEEASNMRKRLEDENYVFNPSTAAASPVDANAGQMPKSASAIAAMVADKLTASSSSQLIMSSVLSSFAAEEAKNAGLTKATTSSNSFTSMPMSSGPNPYQSGLVSQPGSQQAAPSPQTQYHMLSNPASQQYLQPPTGGVMAPYGYGSISPLPPGALPPPPHMMSPMVPYTQPLQPAQQQTVPAPQQQPMPLSQPPAAPTFRPLQPPGLVYYGHPPKSQ
ncbi:hypothetical protein UlMin_038165 [Ulmus minor]